MKELYIGDSVMVSALTEVDYDENDNRTTMRRTCQPFTAKVIGKRRKMLGSYFKGSSGSYFSDYDPAFLKIKGSVLLWEVRHGMLNRPILVGDEDIELTNPVNTPEISAKII